MRDLTRILYAMDIIWSFKEDKKTHDNVVLRDQMPYLFGNIRISSKYSCKLKEEEKKNKKSIAC